MHVYGTNSSAQQNVFQASKLGQVVHLGARKGLRVMLGTFPPEFPEPSFHLVIVPQPRSLDVKASLFRIRNEQGYDLSYYIQNFSDTEFTVSVEKE